MTKKSRQNFKYLENGQKQPPEVFCKIKLQAAPETLAQVFSCEFCEIFKNTFFTEHVWATAF